MPPGKVFRTDVNGEIILNIDKNQNIKIFTKILQKNCNIY